MKPPAWPAALRHGGLWVFAWALAVRAAAWADARHAPFWAFQLVDETAYVDLARGLLQHAALPHGAWYVTPGYAYVLAAAFGAGATPAAVKLAQLFCGAVNAWLVWRLARRLARPAIAAAAAGVFAAAPVVLLQELLLLKTTFATLAVLLAVSWMWPTGESNVRRAGSLRWTGAGLALGATTLLRGELAAVALAFAAAGFVAAWRRWPGAPGRAAALGFCTAWLAAVAVPTVQNARGCGVFVPLAFGGATNLYIGNHAGADGSYLPLRPDRFDPAQEESDAVELASQAMGSPANPAAVSRYWTRAAARFWMQSPGAALRLTLRKAALLLGPWEAADVLSTGQAGRWVRALRNPVAGPALFLPLACAGVWCTRRRRDLWVLHTAAAASFAALLPFFVFERFRIHLLAVAVPFAAAAVDAGWRAVRARGWRPLLLGTGAVVVIACTAGTVRVPRDETVLRVNIGELFFQAGRYDEAMREFAAVRDASPAAWRVGINIANVETARGRRDAALRAIEPVIARLQAEAARTGRPSADELLYCHELAGDLRYDAGEFRTAAVHYREALRYAPAGVVPALRAKLAACSEPAAADRGR